MKCDKKVASATSEREYTTRTDPKPTSTDSVAAKDRASLGPRVASPEPERKDELEGSSERLNAKKEQPSRTSTISTDSLESQTRIGNAPYQNYVPHTDLKNEATLPRSVSTKVGKCNQTSRLADQDAKLDAAEPKLSSEVSSTKILPTITKEARVNPISLHDTREALKGDDTMKSVSKPRAAILLGWVSETDRLGPYTI